MRMHTFGEAVNCQLVMRVLRQIFERNLGLALPYHEMHDDQALKHDSPRRIAQAILQCPEDLGDARLTRVSGHEDMLDIL